MRRLLSLAVLIALFGVLSVPAFAQTNRPQSGDASPIEYGQSINGELTEDALSVEYTFTGSEGDNVLITLDAEDGAFDAYLRLLDEDEVEIAFNDDSRGSLNSQIGPFSLPADGSYTIVATSLNGSDIGEFSISLARVETVAVAYGEETELTFTADQREFYLTFEGESGDIIDIFVDANRANPVDSDLALRDASGYNVITDADSGSGNSPEVTGLSLYSSGMYTLQLTSPESETLGDITVTIVKAEATTLDDGGVTLTFSSSTNQVPLTLSGVEGETIRMTLSVIDGVSSSLSVSIRQGDSSVTDVNSYNVSSLTFDFVVPADGDLAVTVSEYTFDSIEVEVSIERIGE